ncbi:MAG: efflux RND transporter periplasmic adaptor subunit [Gloeotrichia echinulata CP02]
MISDVKMLQKQVKLPDATVPSQVINIQLQQKDLGDGRKASTLSILLVASWLGLGLLTASCGSLPKESADAQSQRRGSGGGGDRATPVDVAIARSELLRQQPDYIGTTTAFRTVSLRSQAEGRLLSLNLDVGDTVTQGQNVGQLDDALLLTALKQAEAELAARKSEVAKATNQVSNARAEVEQRRLEVVQAQADSQRQQKLLKEGAIAAQAAEQAQTKVQTSIQVLRAATEQVRTEQQAVAAAQGRVLVQQAAVAQAKERRSYTRLTSPITGVITEKVTEPGNLLQAGNEVLKIADFSRVKVVVQVSELELANIQVGQSVQVRLDAFPQQTLIGRVTRISPVADATARLVPIEVVIPNIQAKIGSGLLGRVNFQTQSRPQVIIPQTAIQQTQGARGEKQSQTEKENQNGKVFVVTEAAGKTKVIARAVVLGKRADSRVEIITGLEPGERYVVRSGKPLKDGDAVRLSILSEKPQSKGNNK